MIEEAPQATTRAVFLDRDGTIILDKHYLGDPAEVELEPQAAAGLTHLASLGFRLIGVTNQSGIARGYFNMAAALSVNACVDELLAQHGVSIERWYLCPHGSDEGCSCRKPAPGLVMRAASELNLDAAHSYVIGDKLSDLELATAAGGQGILVKTGKGSAFAEAALKRGYLVAADLCHAAMLVEAGLLNEARDDV